MSAPITPTGAVQPSAAAPAAEIREEDPGSDESRAPEARVPESQKRQAVLAALEGVGSRVSFAGRVAEFSFDKDLDRVIVKVFSGETEPREVVRQIPPEEFLAFVTRLRELFGVLLDETI